MYCRKPVSLFSESMNSEKVKIPAPNKMMFCIRFFWKASMKVAHNGFNIKKMNPIPEAMPWIFPEMLSSGPFESSEKTPARIQPTPYTIIPQVYKLWLHSTFVKPDLCSTENAISKIPTMTRFRLSCF